MTKPQKKSEPKVDEEVAEIVGELDHRWHRGTNRQGIWARV